MRASLPLMRDFQACLGSRGAGRADRFFYRYRSLLKNYVTAFDPAFLALRPTPEELPAVAKSSKVFYQKVPGSKPGEYS